MAPATLYQWQQPEATRPAAWEPPPLYRENTGDNFRALAVLAVVLEHPDWGGQRLSDYLLREKVCYISPKEAVALRRQAKEYIDRHGLREKKPRRYEFIRPNDCWCLDFKEIITPYDKYYLCEVIDDRSRLTLSWLLGKKATTALAIATLKIAIQQYGKPVALKTDRGAQFKDQFAAYLKKEAIYHLKSIPYYPRCNAKIERVFRDVEDHVVSRLTATTTLPQLLTMLAEEAYQHNHVRPHQSLGRLTPAEVYRGNGQAIMSNIKALKPNGKHKSWREVPVAEFLPG
ncbi:DDE-type integrase/transposase/recombinase [Moorella sp. Hama-1]|uniref:DDE-type integrase/transposase/recombinase n=1 Tax=Moorella sp. Hama-1 TaxID=2138101 RepID=UPI00137B4D49|nr:DDE-type integrase/transposase/recombinase [Moorella sp. Hama-1]BCV22673.1 integrase [Moorella sp. Hama-1]